MFDVLQCEFCVFPLQGLMYVIGLEGLMLISRLLCRSRARHFDILLGKVV